MAVLVSELQTRTTADITATARVLVVDPDNQELFVIMAEEFRGSSVIFDTVAPTATPANGSRYTRYQDGDVYYHSDLSAGITIHTYDDTNSQWNEIGRIDGNQIWTAATVQEANADASVLILDDAAFSDGDYYLNKARGILYGPHDHNTRDGFNLGSTDYDDFIHQRANETFVYPLIDAQDINNPVLHIPADDQNVNNGVWLPKDGDQIWLQKGGNNGHGGFRYTFSEALYRASTEAAHDDRLAEAFGFVADTGSGTSNTSRVYHREASVRTASDTPVYDTDSYRNGDSVINTAESVMYNGFVEFPADGVDTTDISEIFDSSESLKGSAILSTTVAPVRDDTEYNTGEYIVTSHQGTTRMHGPYVFGASTDVEAWPLTSIVRNPVEHQILYTDHRDGNIMTSYTTDYPVIDNVMVVPGDTMRIIYGPNKTVLLNAGVVIDYGNKTLNWGTSTSNANPQKTHTSTNSGRPARNDTVYYVGDMFMNNVGDVFGPYVENQNTDEDAFPYFYSMAPNRFIDITETFSVNYQLPTANNSGVWGGDFLRVGDTVRVRFNGSTRNKHVLFEVTALGAGDAITWLRTTPDAGQITFSDSFGYPARDDASYYAGDVWISGSGIAYEYNEGQTDDTSAWTFSYYSRATKTFDLTTTNFISSVATYPTAQATASGEFLIVGDRAEYTIAATGKVWSIEVESVDHAAGTVVWVDSIINGRPPLTHNLTTNGQPLLNDNLYSQGDFAITADRRMYGPYVHGQSTNEDSWPLYGDITAPLELTDTSTSEVYEFVVTDGELFLNLK